MSWHNPTLANGRKKLACLTPNWKLRPSFSLGVGELAFLTLLSLSSSSSATRCRLTFGAGFGATQFMKDAEMAGGRKQLPTPVIAALQELDAALSKLYAAASLARPGRKGEVEIQQQVRAVIEKRRFRFDIFPPLLFSDPAWDMLLELYARQLEHRPLNISRLIATLPVAATTAHRWIEKLEAEELVTRRSDPRNAKRIWIDLSERGRNLMDRYFQQPQTMDARRLKRLFEPE